MDEVEKLAQAIMKRLFNPYEERYYVARYYSTDVDGYKRIKDDVAEIIRNHKEAA